MKTTPWLIVYCHKPAQDCRTFWREEGTRVKELPETPLIWSHPEGVDHVHIVLAFSVCDNPDCDCGPEDHK